MKLMPLLIIALIAAGIVMLISATTDMSTYSTFEEVRKAGEAAKVVGVLSKDKPMYYDAEKDPNLFTFYMKDQRGEEHLVSLSAGKPQDF